MFFAKNEKERYVSIKELENRNLLKNIAKEKPHILQDIWGNDGRHLKAEVFELLKGLKYQGNKNNKSASWDDVYRIIGETGLDSSDAMIFNMAIHNSSIDGIIISDKDYRLCKRYLVNLKKDFRIWIIEKDFKK